MESLTGIPEPAGKRIAVKVKPAAERAIRQGHPWLFNHSIRYLSHKGASGDLAVIFDAKDRFLAVGLYDPLSPIRVRILHHGKPTLIDGGWFRARLSQAFERRSSIQGSSTTGYRLLHGENDGVPGLVLDRYDDSGVIRLDTTAWLPHLHQVLSEALALVPLERLVLRLGRLARSSSESLDGIHDGQLLFGEAPSHPVVFSENGLRFESDLVLGQKTGFFLDQRDNRSRLEGLIRQDNRLRRVLNIFAYTGGFSVYAARAGADQLTNVDASQAALDGAARNLRLNRDQWAKIPVSAEAICADAFATLQELNRAGRQFDVVVIDPPSFASSQKHIQRAKGAYRHLAQLGVTLLCDKGLLVMSSCSSRIGSEEFFALVMRAAAEAGRPLQEVDRTGHPLDHPIGFPEGAYLKCLFARAR